MLTFNDLPYDIHFEVAKHVAASSPENLINLTRTSKLFKTIVDRCPKTFLGVLADNILDERFARDALQAKFSNNTTILDTSTPVGGELTAWKVKDPRNDIWCKSFTGDCRATLQYLITLHKDINACATQLLQYCAYRRRPQRGQREHSQRQHSVRRWRVDSERDNLTKCSFQLSDAAHEKVVKALWLQESIRLRNDNRSPFKDEDLEYLRHGPDKTEPPRWIPTERTEEWMAEYRQAITRRRQRSHLYFRYLRRINDQHYWPREMGRWIQTVLRSSKGIEDHPVWKQKVGELNARWEWEPRARDFFSQEWETDWDMLHIMPAVEGADMEFEKWVEKTSGWLTV